ncbi:hypothetical protein IB238_09275 [Rhizobium sp. ARZ01]|uniref:hypothetical protein n=1 Tax=Rhizobium sp. ARZ01 TaxID=2769313 RepID=UPI00178727FA|nr:hypothetical protein [Rhizobium sp. ARZ01]MBD9372809.1 hypothetical protein [Rhizobium sp. ARZ01]
MIISIFSRKHASATAPVERIPDHDKARRLVDTSIDRLRARADFLQGNIERDAAELRETDRILEALLEAKAKVAPPEIEVDQSELEAIMFSEAAE